MTMHRNFLISLFVVIIMLFSNITLFADSDSNSEAISFTGASGTMTVTLTRPDWYHVNSTHTIYINAYDTDVEGSWGGILQGWNSSPAPSGSFHVQDWDSADVSSGDTFSDQIYLPFYDSNLWVIGSSWFAKTWAELEGDSDNYDEAVWAEL